MADDVDVLIADQITYYRARAAEYDEVYLDRELPDSLIDDLPISGEVLELACGTGRWTSVITRRARSITAVDAAPEMLAVAEERVKHLPVGLVTADVFTWRPPRRYDTVFFAFWLSHIPPARFPGFWAMVRDALKPGGQACFLDTSDREQEAEEVLSRHPAPTVRRRLNDGSEHRAVKTFHTPAQLTAELAALGWSARIHRVQPRILAGTAALDSR